jgi:CheY-like chemotaxis protein
MDKQQPRQLLLVDDDQDDLDFFTEAIRENFNNVECISITNPKLAYDRLSSDGFQPDLIFLDLNMPKMNGRELLTAIRNLPKLKKTPVVIYTTSSERKDQEDTAKLGASYFFTKPTRLEDLRNQLKHILSIDWLKS